MARYKVTMVCKETWKAEKIIRTENLSMEEIKDAAWSDFDGMRSRDLEQENYTKIERIE